MILPNGLRQQLPRELVESLDQTYFLHLLVNQPDSVLPPGKSLLSMMTHANLHPKNSPLHDQVAKAVGDTFWDEAVRSLSSPEPSLQLVRLAALYRDLRDTAAPLFPPQHPVMRTLENPPPPTTSPLISTIFVLKDVLVSLRQRCAPVRDASVDSLIFSLSVPPLAENLQAAEYIPRLASFVATHFKSIFSLVEDMKTDVNTYALGEMNEGQLRDVLFGDVKKRERSIIAELWGGTGKIRELWRLWLADLSPGATPATAFGATHWSTRLLYCLGSDKAVACVPPYISNKDRGDPSGYSELPPQLFFWTATLWYLQNYLQAVVITAALKILASSKSSASSSQRSSFSHRVWTLLKSEVDSHSMEPEIKLINLADEVIQERRRVDPSSTLSEGDEKLMRAAVERTLKATDPVFALLRKRLIEALIN